MLLSKNGEKLAVFLKIKIDQSETSNTIKILKDTLKQNHIQRFNQNQIDALILLINYIGKNNFLKSIVLKSISNTTEENIAEYFQLTKDKEPLNSIYKQVGWNFRYEGRRFSENMMEGDNIGKKLGELFNKIPETKKN